MREPNEIDELVREWGKKTGQPFTYYEVGGASAVFKTSSLSPHRMKELLQLAEELGVYVTFKGEVNFLFELE